MAEIFAIPGLIEKGEYDALVHFSSSVPKDSSIVEVGCYLGKSTSALLAGANKIDGVKVHVFDGYKVLHDNPFAKTLINQVNQVGLLNLISKDKEGFLHWEKVFDELMKQVLTRMNSKTDLSWTKCDCSKVKWSSDENISLMHIDAPKHYEDARAIIFRMFPSLLRDSVVIFQDFFYHWSASIIASVSIFHKHGFFEFDRSFASSLHVRVLKTFTPDNLLELDLDVANTDSAKEIQRFLPILDANREKFDRYEYFRGRIELACFQELVANKRGDEAANYFGDMLRRNVHNNPQVLSDLVEMFRNNFAID